MELSTMNEANNIQELERQLQQFQLRKKRVTQEVHDEISRLAAELIQIITKGFTEEMQFFFASYMEQEIDAELDDAGQNLTQLKVVGNKVQMFINMVESFAVEPVNFSEYSGIDDNTASTGKKSFAAREELLFEDRVSSGHKNIKNNNNGAEGAEGDCLSGSKRLYADYKESHMTI
jgi:hypothetical protein